MRVSDRLLLERQARSQRGFYRALGEGSEGASAVQVSEGVQATLVPRCPWYSIFNGVVYEDASRLADALPLLPRLFAARDIGGWSVWTRPGDHDSETLLKAEGYAPEASPMVMGLALQPPKSSPSEGVDRSVTWRDVAACNDRAHGVLPEWSMAAAFDRMHDPATRRYAKRDNGEVVAALLARHEQGDCYFWFVATAPEAQRQGLGRELMQAALADAAAGGCATATLESTRAGEHLYRSLGFRALGRSARWARYHPGAPRQG